MGLFINLTAQLNRIEPSDWEAAYRDSLVLLQRFPATLIRHDSQKGCDRQIMYQQQHLRHL